MSVSELALISRFLGLYSFITGYSMCVFQLAAGRVVGWVFMGHGRVWRNEGVEDVGGGGGRVVEKRGILRLYLGELF